MSFKASSATSSLAHWAIFASFFASLKLLFEFLGVLLRDA
jgi:hypothetical protein